MGTTTLQQFPDVSSWQDGLKLQPGTVAVIAKATQGLSFTDAAYQGFKAQAAAIRALFSGYHWLTNADPIAQADHAFSVVGPTVPLMLDAEKNEDTGYIPTVPACRAFIDRYTWRGGRVWGVYFPRWCWEIVKGDLSSLGVALVASGYVAAYSDTDPNWEPYGNKAPDVWQYTNKQPYGGKLIDFNAFRGTLDQLAALIMGDTMDTTTPVAYPAGADQYFENIASGLGPIISGNFPLGKTAGLGTTLAYANMRACANLALSAHMLVMMSQMQQVLTATNVQLANLTTAVTALQGGPAAATGGAIPGPTAPTGIITP